MILQAARALVAVVPASNFRKFHHRTKLWRLNGSGFGSIFTAPCGYASGVIIEIRLQSSPQRPLVEDQDVVKAFSPGGGHESFRARILPNRSRACQHFMHTHALHSLTKGISVIPSVLEVDLWRAVLGDGGLRHNCATSALTCSSHYAKIRCVDHQPKKNP